MFRNFTFEMSSRSPIEVVYGLSEKILAEIQSEHSDTEGYDWCILLDDAAEQREEFMSGIDLDDAQLIVTDQDGQKRNFRFLPKAEC